MSTYNVSSLGSPDGIPLVKLTGIWANLLGEGKTTHANSKDKLSMGLAIKKHLPRDHKNVTKKEFISALAMAHFTSTGSLRASFENLISDYSVTKNINDVINSVGISLNFSK